MTQGRFITLEGIEGVGKSTQVGATASLLTSAGHTVVCTREPGGTPLAERIRGLVLHDGGEALPPAAELCLMFAARAVHTENLIRPALARNAVVLCDRYTDATYAYQGGGRGVPDEDIAALARIAGRGLKPDLTILLDAPIDIALSRARGRGTESDRFERETIDFFTRVRAKYLALAHAEPTRIAVVDATGEVATVSKRIAMVLSQRGLI
jgi:dTMP kinase